MSDGLVGAMEDPAAPGAWPVTARVLPPVPVLRDGPVGVDAGAVERREGRRASRR